MYQNQPCQQQNGYAYINNNYNTQNNSAYYFQNQIQRPRLASKQQQMEQQMTQMGSAAHSKWQRETLGVGDREFKELSEERQSEPEAHTHQQQCQEQQQQFQQQPDQQPQKHSQEQPAIDQAQSETQTHTQQEPPPPPPTDSTHTLTQQPSESEQTQYESNAQPPEPQNIIEGECFVSIDVECAATGHGHFDLLPCRVAMVDFYGNVLFDRVCSPVAVVDPLQEFTGLTAWQIKRAPPLAAVLSEFHELLSWLNLQYRHGVTVVGQSIVMDLVWARLIPNTHYRRTIDIAQLFRTPNSNFEYKKWHYYSLRQAAWALLGVSMNTTFHDPTEDARITIQLYRDFCLSPSVLHSAKQRLQNFKASCSFPDFRVVTKFKQCSAMYAPSRCRCGQKTAVGIEGVEDLEKLRALYVEHMNKPVLYEQYS